MKNILVTFLILLTFNAYADSQLNDVSEQQKNELERIINVQLLGNDPALNDSGDLVRHIKQLGSSSTYLFKLFDSGSVHTLAYFSDTKSILVMSDANLIRLDDQSSIKQEYEASYVKPMLERIDPKDVIAMPASGESATKVYVFTDPTCGYCRKLHSELTDYQKKGISIQYLPYPRGGKAGPGFKMLVNAYCSKDRKTALSFAKANNSAPSLPESITAKQLQQCEDIVNKYYALGNELGVTGTPAIYAESGYQLGGYVPANVMQQRLQ
ncbi:DsbC family protein [Vibrio sp. 10N.261.55.A7]|uniref:DsbC family protein n=1 Tax=Vibrio sp. 10N.261.55.A7 TaxID=1880851 RepID=UPI000C84FAD8|nr:DsbC family protein [Vibrio sp. 10N.261.55.A7]PMK04484.1 hypothetical protein BCU12_02460 [Vibrio sp. 10N.261.55.A7]